MYVHIFGYFVNKLEIWWVYLSPIESVTVIMKFNHILKCNHEIVKHIAVFIKRYRTYTCIC